MTEPWQADRAEDGAGHLCSRFVCRVSGAPVDTVDTLRAPRALALLSRLAEVEAALRDGRESLSATLFDAIGRAEEKPARNKLITLKRELYNLRPVSAQKLDEGAALLPPAAGDEVRGFQARLEERARLEAELKTAYAEETAGLRARFRRLLDDGDFRKGLMISSRSLHGALARYQGQGAELSGKEEKTERGLLRYYTRMAAKATPFATFCAIIPGTFVEPSGDFGGDVFRFRGDPRRKRSFVRINKLLYGILLDHLKTRATVRHALEVELNPTLREEQGRLVYLTAIQSREVFQRLGNNDVLELITAKIRGRERPTMGDLIDALVTDPQVEASPEEAEAYLDKLIEIGFLRFHTGVGEQDADWDLPFRALLERIGDDHARQGAELLVAMREKTEAYTDADVEGRARIIEEIHGLVNGAIDTMEIQGRLRRDMPFYEDATSAASAEIPLTPEVRGAVDVFSEWVRVTTRLAWPRPEQATMRHFFDTYYTDRKTIPLLQFYEDFYREHFKTHVEKEAKIRAGVQEEELKGYNVGNPFGLEFINQLNAARTRLMEVLQARWREAPDAVEINLTAAELEEALRGVETTSGICRSMGAFALLLPPSTDGNETRLLLQGSSYTAGYGKYFSR
ncbi:MAG TPA: lantibiotic dehydratase, partial [Longimicrobium sp.]|nr:lantibiotic dehydratase [Longimicrobium sp.]